MTAILSAAASSAGVGAGRRPPVRLAAVAVALTFVLALVLLVGSAVLLGINVAGLRRGHALTEHTGEVLRRAAELEALVRDAETGQRGYLLTDEKRYLRPYEAAIEQVWKEFDELAALEMGRPQQMERLARLKPVIEAKLAELRRTIDLRARSFEDALAVVRTDEGQRLMEEIRARLLAFEDAERAMLRGNGIDEERQTTWTTALAAATGLLATLSALAGVYLLFRQRDRERLLRLNEELERTVEERTARLVEANRELDAFAYTISHDLRAPLRAMHGYADALVEDHADRLDEEGRHYTQRITAAATQMANLIEDLLAYSRLAREEIACHPVSLSKLVDKVLADGEAAIAEAGARVEVLRPLPDVLAHPPALRQALANLIGNAVKFAAPGVAPRVRIRAETRGSRVRLWVEDNGIGIDSGHQERIFRPFERLHGAESYPGTGIGLAIVRKSLERMGGASGVESLPGEGSRFWIELAGAGPAEEG